VRALQPVQDLVSGGGSEIAALLTGFVAVPFDLLEQDPRVRGPALRQLREVAGELFNSLASDLWHDFLLRFHHRNPDVIIREQVGPSFIPAFRML
jgi:hypothetical protein